ncbi:LEA type 2 family protein [Phycisphaera mikurensis]|uniref:LEA type 2 family protein n=1 Tax=Phycisphaera mikurensis TaxID=547188 RepID=UPI0012B63B01|nr:LEA type 2 family protein [Phycisphaera mikurensis]MBB6443228.1 hypothetical protein [Phycisphaera mikurensis]
MRLRPAVLVTSMLLPAVAGCGIPRSIGRAVTEGFVERPTIELVDLAVTRRTPEGVAFAATVEMSNPNAVELPLSGIGMTLSVKGLGSFDAPSPPSVSLPPRGSKRMVLRGALPAPVPADATLDGRAYRCAVAATYVPPGELREIGTESGFPLPVTRTSVRGTLGRADAGT